MIFFTNDLLPIITSFNILLPYINHIAFWPDDVRSFAIYYETNTSDVATYIIKYINVTKYPLAVLNLDDPNLDSRKIDDVGNNFFNIMVFQNLTSPDIMRRWYKHVYKDARNYYMYIISERANQSEISYFLSDVWDHEFLSSTVIFWNEYIEFYTSYPFQKNFSVKIFEIHYNEPIILPQNAFEILYGHKGDDLGNRTFNVFIVEDAPKVFRIPAKYRTGNKFHFGGRDGFFARLTEDVLNAHFQYRTLPDDQIIKLTEFAPSNDTFKTDIYGNSLEDIVDDAKAPNVDYVSITENFTLA